MSDPKEAELAEAAAKMEADKSGETEDALERSLAVQGEREDGDVIGADEEE